jgi:hypothetical protein
VLRIDETSKTLVAPPAGGLVTEASPDRSELLALLGGSWDAFSAELGHPGLSLVAVAPAPGLDLLALDEPAGRLVVVQVAAAVEAGEVGRGLVAAAQVASWDAVALAAVDERLAAIVSGDSPQVVLIAGGFDPAAMRTLEWLAARHRLELSGFAVSLLRFGGERLLTVRREFPPREDHGADPAPQLHPLLGDAIGVATAGAASTPPPGL